MKSIPFCVIGFERLQMKLVILCSHSLPSDNYNTMKVSNTNFNKPIFVLRGNSCSNFEAKLCVTITSNERLLVVVSWQKLYNFMTILLRN
jgi:hypothetical protein